MTKTLAGIAVAGVLAFGAIGGWYYARTTEIETEEKTFADWAKTIKLVPVKFVVKAPPETPADQPLYIAGSAPSLGAWADAAAVPLVKQADGTYTASAELMTGLEAGYKVTRSTWGTVERGPKGEEIPNHTIIVKAPDEVINVTVESWVDKGQSTPGRNTIAGTTRQHRKFHSDLLPLNRDIYVYLPPGYEQLNNTQRYPVLYMQDGQNLFNEATSFNGIEWKLDEAAEHLIKEGKIEPIIIVGVFNTEQRTAEFTPAAMASGESKSDLYAKVFVDEIKSMIDSQYRTLAGAEHTAIGGSSMGGLIDLVILKQYPETFGKVALLTPHLRSATKNIYAALGDDLSFLKGKKIWIDMGDAGGDNYPGTEPLSDAKQFVEKLKTSGAAETDIKYTEYPGGEHNEAAWQSRADQVLIYLFSK